MESEIKTKAINTKTSTSIPNTITRVLDYESNSKSSLPYLTSEPVNKSELYQNPENTSPKQSSVPFLSTPTKKTFPQMKHALKSTTSAVHADSPFTYFCKGSEYSPRPSDRIASKEYSKGMIDDQRFHIEC